MHFGSSSSISLYVPICLGTVTYLDCLLLKLYKLDQVVAKNLIVYQWNSIGLEGPTHGIVTKTVHKTLPRSGGGLVGGEGI